MAQHSQVVADELKKLEGIIATYAAVPVPTHLVHALPPSYRRHASSDLPKPATISLVQVATAQAFGRPFESFSEDQVRRAFHLGDTEGAPPGSPARSSVEVPKPAYRTFFSREAVDEKALRKAAQQQQQQAQQAAVAVAPAATAGSSKPIPKLKLVLPTGGRGGGGGGGGAVPSLPPGKRLKATVAGAAVPPTLPAAPAPVPAPAPPPPPPPPPPPVRAPSPLVLPPAPVVDISKLAGRRKVSDLTQPEVLTIAEEIVKKLRARKCRAWKNTNPLETEIYRENCASLNIPHYFDVIETPMNLKLINVR